MLPQITRDAFAGDSANSGADLLNRHHQGIAEQHRPRDREAELGAGLAIGRNAAGVVVGCACDKARAEYSYEPQPFWIECARLRDDQMMLGIHSDLHFVADDARAAPAP